ncbi:MAG: hypothetical protein AAGA58_01645 [Verrucomicrobiota bacterium]
MAEDEWQLIKCASCNGLIRLDPKQSAPVATCPHCNAQIIVPGARDDDVPVAGLAVGGNSPAAEPRTTRPPSRNADVIPPPGERKPKEPKAFNFTAKRSFSSANALQPDPLQADTDEKETRPAPTASATSDSHLPPEKEKAAFEIQSDVIRNTNRPAHEVEAKQTSTPSDKPRLDNLKKLASTEEERFAADQEADERIVTESRIRRAEKQLVTWEDEEDETGAKSSHLPLRRILTFSAFGLVICTFGGIVAYGVISNSANTAQRQTPVFEEKVEDLGYSQMVKADIEKSVAIIRAFLNAPSWRERLEFCRMPDRISPLAEEFYRGKEDGPINFRKIEEGSKAQLFENFFITRVVLDDFSERIVAVEKTGEESFLVDWESFVAYCEIPWAQMPVEKPTSPVLMRVIAFYDSYFNFDFESNAYSCFRLQSNDGNHTLYGYTMRGTQIDRQMRARIADDDFKRPLLTLEVAYPRNPKSDNQVLIKGMAEVGWVIRPGSEKRVNDGLAATLTPEKEPEAKEAE